MGVPDLTCSLTRAVLVTENHCKHDEQLLSGHSYIYIYIQKGARATYLIVLFMQ